MASQQGGGYDDNDAYIHGHCACGLLRYRIDVRDIDDVLQLATYCHCARCQRLNGAPYIWSNHWLYRAVEWFPTPANPPPGAPDLPDGETGAFSANMQVYELMKGRKWKLRCRECGSPMGSWNAYKKKWTIWPTTFRRKQSTTPNAPTGVLAEGDLDISDRVMAKVKADHHQFYGGWRSVTLADGLPKYEGYRGESQQVTDAGVAIQ